MRFNEILDVISLNFTLAEHGVCKMIMGDKAAINSIILWVVYQTSIDFLIQEYKEI